MWEIVEASDDKAVVLFNGRPLTVIQIMRDYKAPEGAEFVTDQIEAVAYGLTFLKPGSMFGIDSTFDTRIASSSGFRITPDDGGMLASLLAAL